jgi:hypothetical protein
VRWSIGSSDEKTEKVIEHMRYKDSCASAGIPCYIDHAHRALENLYPPSLLAGLFGVNDSVLPETHPYASVKDLNTAWSEASGKTKNVHLTRVAEKVAAGLSREQAAGIPAVEWLYGELSRAAHPQPGV